MKTERTVNHDRANVRSVIIAAGAASLFMLVFGVGYRVLAARLAEQVEGSFITQETLDQLPWQIGAWVGQDVPLPADVVEATDTDAHVSRQYSKGNGLESVWLWIASGVQTRDLMPHRPEVCYVGNGYTLTHQQDAELSLESGGTLPCNLMEFTRGVMGGDKVLVLYYYIVDGVYCRSVAQWRYQVFRRIGYVTQVQVVAPVVAMQPRDAVAEMVRGFSTDSAAPILGLFAGVQQSEAPK